MRAGCTQLLIPDIRCFELLCRDNRFVPAINDDSIAGQVASTVLRIIPAYFSYIEWILYHIRNIPAFPLITSACSVAFLIDCSSNRNKTALFFCPHVENIPNHIRIVRIRIRNRIGTFFFDISDRRLTIISTRKRLLRHASLYFTGQTNRVVFIHPLEDTLYQFANHTIGKRFGYGHNINLILF